MRTILGVSVAAMTADALTARIDDAVEARTPLRLAFLNANLANVASATPELSAVLPRFLVVNDGIGTDIASWMLYGRRFPQNLNGTDFTSYFLETTRHPLRLFLIGARSPVVARAARLIEERWPRHAVVGTRDGYFHPDEEASLAEEVQAAAPDIVLVGMGNPRQELWIAKNVPAVSCCAFAIGAWFDFMTGEVRRAPQWMRDARLEWCFRLGCEPRRLWRRYLVGNVVFLARVLRQRFQGQV